MIISLGKNHLKGILSRDITAMERRAKTVFELRT
jgi:hypothetical protein